MNTNAELEVWRDAWKDPAQTAATQQAFDLRRETHRQERYLRIRYVLAFVWAAAFLIFSVVAVRNGLQRIPWALVVWITTFIAMGFSIWNWRTLWNATSASTSEFADLYAKRCMAKLRAVRFGYWFLAMQLAIAVPWLSWDFYRGGDNGQFGIRSYVITMLVLACITAIFIFSFTRTRRATLRELEQLRDFQKGGPS